MHGKKKVLSITCYSQRTYIDLLFHYDTLKALERQKKHRDHIMDKVEADCTIELKAKLPYPVLWLED